MRCKQRGRPPARCAQAALALSHLQPRLCTQVTLSFTRPSRRTFLCSMDLDCVLMLVSCRLRAWKGNACYVTSTDYEGLPNGVHSYAYVS